MIKRKRSKVRVNAEIVQAMRSNLAIARLSIADGVMQKSRIPLRRAYKMLNDCEKLLELLLVTKD